MAAYDDPRLVRRAQTVDIARAVPLGVLLPIETTVLLTIAIKHFDASWWVKSLVSGAGGVGLLAAPAVTALARNWGRPAMVVTSTMSVLAGLGLLLASAGPLPLFVTGSIIGIATVNVVYPLTTVTYARVFPPSELGRRVGWGLSTKVLVAAVSGLAIGQVLGRRLDLWWAVVAAAGVMGIVLGGLDRLMPSAPVEHVEGVPTSVRPHFHLLAEDRLLRRTIVAWMVMGFGNLMLMPLRVEYLAKPEYGIDASTASIIVLTAVVPSAVRLVSLPVFGMVFDRVDFFTGRVLVNLLFAMYVAAFFTGTSWTGLVIGAVVLGVASAGGELTWSLWVTKFAPPGRMADYMGLHTFFTGVRSFGAPLLGFAVLGNVSLTAVAAIAAGLMVASSAVLVPEIRAERRARRRLPISA